MESDAIVAIQDMGAAGLTSSSFEMASKGGVGIELDLDHVPCREEKMTAYEIMLSESQERMLMILKPGREDVARAVFEKWELDFAVIGKVTDTGRMILKKDGAVAADLPVAPLADAAPMYDRPVKMTPKPAPLGEVPAVADLGEALLTLLGSPDLSRKEWVWRQYDHMVMADTVIRPGGDASMVRVHGTRKALAVTTDCTPRYAQADPEQGGAQAVAETWRNITATGARPLAITDCMNFGNPERPEIMGQFAGCIEGMRQACLALDYPVVSGNVSLYNETNGQGVQPTPSIGGVGVIDDWAKAVGIAPKADGEVLVLIGETKGHLGQSIYLRELFGREDGPPPPVDLAAERRHGDFVRTEILAGHVAACHDIADGGLAVAVAEMCLAAGRGAEIALPAGAPHAAAFGEDQARYILSLPAAGAAPLLDRAAKAGVPAMRLGRIGGDRLTLPGGRAISLRELRSAHEGWLPNYMAG
jgi:phosphoribosylformylglycinamidine synthase